MRPPSSAMLEYSKQIEAAVDAVKQRWPVSPQVGIILGSGLGGIAREIDAAVKLDYSEIPCFPRTTALGHRGRLVCGSLAGVPVVAFQGRFHLYEGHSAQQVAMPVRLLQALGAETLLITNAAGGVNSGYAVGDVMLIEDQINLMFANPLVGVNDDQLGPRFPDMSAPFDCELMEVAAEVARRGDFVLHKGVYVSMVGPNYETRAEYRMVRRLGGDAVGMSTVPEVIAARHAGIRVLGLATITNLGLPDVKSKTTGHDVLAAAATAASKIGKIVEGVVACSAVGTSVG